MRSPAVHTGLGKEPRAPPSPSLCDSSCKDRCFTGVRVRSYCARARCALTHAPVDDPQSSWRESRVHSQSRSARPVHVFGFQAGGRRDAAPSPCAKIVHSNCGFIMFSLSLSSPSRYDLRLGVGVSRRTGAVHAVWTRLHHDAGIPRAADSCRKNRVS